MIQIKHQWNTGLIFIQEFPRDKCLVTNPRSAIKVKTRFLFHCLFNEESLGHVGVFSYKHHLWNVWKYKCTVIY